MSRTNLLSLHELHTPQPTCTNKGEKNLTLAHIKMFSLSLLSPLLSLVRLPPSHTLVHYHPSFFPRSYTLSLLPLLSLIPLSRINVFFCLLHSDQMWALVCLLDYLLSFCHTMAYYQTNARTNQPHKTTTPSPSFSYPLSSTFFTVS